MTDVAETTMALYRGLLAEEEKVLRGLENDVVSVVLNNHINARPVWESRTDASGRFVRLYFFDTPATPLFELPSSQIAVLTPYALRSLLGEKLRHPKDS